MIVRSGGEEMWWFSLQNPGTPLFVAHCENAKNNEDVCILLLETGANADVMDKVGCMDRCMEGWMDGSLNGYSLIFMGKCIYGKCMDRFMDG